jgi:hypothetical protein
MEQTVLLACVASTWFMTWFPPGVWSAPTSCALLPGRCMGLIVLVMIGRVSCID